MEYLEYQPVMNIGLLGNVSHGKSTLVKVLTGISTQKSKREKINNSTQKLGYANCRIYEMDGRYNIEEGTLVNHFSFVDCPGHNDLIDVMMSGATLMDGAIVVIAANENPKSLKQLKQHLLTAKLLNIEKLIFVLNKCDLVSEAGCLYCMEYLKEIFEEFEIDNPIVIPMSLNFGLNVNYLLEGIMCVFNPVLKEIGENTVFNISRSFDVNKPGTKLENLKGGVVGGSLLSGRLEPGDEIEIRPGEIEKDDKNFKTKAIVSRVLSIQTGECKLEGIIPGGLMGLCLNIDPYFTKDNKLKDQMLFKRGYGMDVYDLIRLDIEMLEDYKLSNMSKYKLYVGSGVVNSIHKDSIFKFELPKCVDITKRILICIELEGTLTIIGYGMFKEGRKV